MSNPFDGCVWVPPLDELAELAYRRQGGFSRPSLSSDTANGAM